MQFKCFLWTMIASSTLMAATLRAQSDPPTVTGFTPMSGPVGTLVHVVGTNLDQITEVDFFPSKITNLNHVNSGQITANVPVGASTGKITLKYAMGSVATATNFTVTGDNGAFIDPPNVTAPAGALTGHPRIFLSADDLPTYRAWAKASNPTWVDLLATANEAKLRMDQHKVPDQDLGDGGSNYNPYPTEEYAELFAFMSLVDKTEAKRAEWASRAHTLIMYIFNLAGQGVGADTDPFRNKRFSAYNRSRWYGEAFPCTVDWIYQTFTPSEKTIIRRVFLRWIQENLRASVTAGEHPQPLGAVNDPSLLTSAPGITWSANNYYANHARQVGMLAMALDDVDDVPLLAGDPPSGTLRKFVGNAIGAWLYQVDAAEQDPLKGGLFPEGLGYGESTSSGFAMLLLGMQTTHTNDVAAYGPAADMASRPFWSQEFLDSYIHSMSPGLTTQYNWIGPSCLPATFGDDANYWIVNYIRTLGPLALIARKSGDQAVYDKVRWMIDAYEPGSGASRHYQLTSSINGYGTLLNIFYFMIVDPHEAARSDPRPAIALDYFDAGLGRVLSRTKWKSTAAWFTYKCSYNRIDHQGSDGQKLEFYRNGEWLTKGRQGYGFNVEAADFQNSLTIENPAVTQNSFWTVQMQHGGQFSYHPAGDPTVWHSFNPKYAYVQSDATKLYNCPAINANDVAHVSRSVLWLKPDTIVVYDRADSKSNNRFKRVFFNTQNLASVTGKTATATTPNGQKLAITSLLPAVSAMTAQSVPTDDAGPEKGETATGEMMQCRIMVDATGGPQSARFLTVLQGVDGGVAPLASALVQQSSGDAFDGAVFGTTAVLFRGSITTAFTSTTFVLPATVTSVYIGGLTPGATSTTTKKSVAGGKQYTVVPGAGTAADAGGLVKV